MRTQSFQFNIQASPETVYKALIDEKLLPLWRVPDGMTMDIHEFSPVEGGTFRISLIYHDESASGKSTRHTDTYSGHFARLIPNKMIVEIMEFESVDPALRGKMKITTNLEPHENGTQLLVSHENLPAVVPSEQNEIGWKTSLMKLAKLIERA